MQVGAADDAAASEPAGAGGTDAAGKDQTTWWHVTVETLLSVEIRAGRAVRKGHPGETSRGPSRQAPRVGMD